MAYRCRDPVELAKAGTAAKGLWVAGITDNYERETLGHNPAAWKSDKAIFNLFYARITNS
ncbi:MAG TPA: hypothetical protein VK463_17825 [Desulfomonilaceae bacterium]|nr:hypothetical protein [Desulfomonilaceae bacterium]